MAKLNVAPLASPVSVKDSLLDCLMLAA
jgi:hypothetical protein